VAWFIIAYLTGHPITIYGNGKQVRDILYVDDLVEFYDLLISKIDIVKGSAFNMGGGISNSLSLLEYFNVLQKISSQKIGYSFSDWRPGDQAIFISDNSFATQKTGFSPKTSCVDGISKIYNWLLLNLPSSGLNSQNRRNIQVM
jgi:CDP-paratose 2-epimerase